VDDKRSGEGEERIIRGAEAIAEFIFGDRSHRRKVLPRGMLQDSDSQVGKHAVPAAVGL
jgi:hypothetical protein